jgi:hypothetical protein
MAGASQGEQPQGHRTDANGGGSNHSTNMGAGDMTEITANLMSLLKQFMESMHKKEEAKEAGQEMNNEQKEKGCGGETGAC